MGGGDEAMDHEMDNSSTTSHSDVQHVQKVYGLYVTM